MYKRVLLTFVLLISIILLPLHAAAAPASISTHAEAAALIDVHSGRILYSQSGDKEMRVASTTKIMTAIIAIEQGRLSDMVKVGKNAAGKEGSSLYLKLGEEMSLHNLLYGMMLRSGNDAAIAIAEHIGGSIEGFAYLMNEKASLLGMAHTHFTNPSGLDDGKEMKHYSSANDMAKLTAYALKNPVFRDIVKTKTKKAPNPNANWDYSWSNKNKMLNLYEGADGVKTGYTKLAYRCLVSSATRGNQQLAAVTLNDGNDWADHAKLLDYGFETYPLKQVLQKGEAVSGTNWVAGRSFAYPFHGDEQKQMISKVVSHDPKSLEYRTGERGLLTFYLGEDHPIGTIPLYEPESPGLNKTEQSVFEYKPTEVHMSAFSKATDAFRTVIASLFMMLGSGME
ncbi:D-alanyl-D-alanine carboxypeptidase DacB [Paenibacillus larvae subsp. larvae]|uniref:D-alanyl-D-alanine carboxypeptidase DacB n=1 Tax=Paenibacillus larvae subsp. larvae TaxID=147375 RepID=A0A2L1TYI4_9BACL|nr:D-alanyl-D-alanine carboxypeptidase family protein [Paenibacillus larvae]AQT86217.1 D-alanyl-D-alanine carboxypeptidase [Paenibacillus larvae subsp. pulvifaciens]AQZ47843.1 D-alanyl-D-alanine carboxypeptidase [Paenibacillus larvae subsp. pulvifaciens]AVF25733.1 D-alanyl-D-alanine carboxypeptidase DacB [Paenibacillus larvae subsp. larvae]AVF30510.1 D-alanyl-D-alanine carboxypeptidase DacB [Paenibacillus larvae subsp. larvae]MBH0341932.1 peptidase M15 [Paenibacillus larvae]